MSHQNYVKLFNFFNISTRNNINFVNDPSQMSNPTELFSPWQIYHSLRLTNFTDWYYEIQLISTSSYHYRFMALRMKKEIRNFNGFFFISWINRIEWEWECQWDSKRLEICYQISLNQFGFLKRDSDWIRVWQTAYQLS